MMNKLILSSVFCLSVLALAGQTPVKEFDFTSGKFPAGTEPMLSKRCVGKLYNFPINIYILKQKKEKHYGKNKKS